MKSHVNQACGFLSFYELIMIISLYSCAHRFKWMIKQKLGIVNILAISISLSYFLYSSRIFFWQIIKNFFYFPHYSNSKNNKSQCTGWKIRRFVRSVKVTDLWNTHTDCSKQIWVTVVLVNSFVSTCVHVCKRM